jgi:hypothetical protein
MKKQIAILALCLPLMFAGCRTVSTTQPLAPGYMNSADQTMGQTLAASHAFYQSIQQDSAAGKIVLSAQEKTALNDFAVALNVAQTAYLAYHGGTVTQAQAQAAVNSSTAKQTTVQALIPGVK